MVAKEQLFAMMVCLGHSPVYYRLERARGVYASLIGFRRRYGGYRMYAGGISKVYGLYGSRYKLPYGTRTPSRKVWQISSIECRHCEELVHLNTPDSEIDIYRCGEL